MATREENTDRIVDLRDDASAPQGDTGRRFRVVLICTGNRCRSPLAEALLKNYGAGLPLEVTSAGLLELGGMPAPPESIEVAQSLGVDLSEHRTRPMAGLDLSEADLVLGFEWGHVAAAVVEGRAPYERVFTLRQFLRLTDGLNGRTSADRVKNAKRLVAQAHGRRGSVPGFDRADNIDDPFGGPRDGFVDTARAEDELCRALVERLFGNNGHRRAAGSLIGFRRTK
jgi:protein-tyrosine phosphatase